MKRKSILGGIAAAGLLFAGHTAQADLLWDAGSPAASGFPAAAGAPTGFAIDSPVVGIMTQDTAPATTGVWQTTDASQLPNASGWFMEFRVDTSSNNAAEINSTTPYLQVAAVAADSAGGLLVGVLTDRARIFKGGGSAGEFTDTPTFTDGFHTFRITRTAGNTTSLDLAIDGVTVIAGHGDGFVGLPIRAGFGDYTSTGSQTTPGGPPTVRGGAEWDRVSITVVPEPASGAVVIGAAAVLGAARRRRRS